MRVAAARGRALRGLRARARRARTALARVHALLKQPGHDLDAEVVHGREQRVARVVARQRARGAARGLRAALAAAAPQAGHRVDVAARTRRY